MAFLVLCCQLLAKPLKYYVHSIYNNGNNQHGVIQKFMEKTLKACPINPNNSQGWAASKEKLSCYSVELDGNVLMCCYVNTHL
jgi:hypothetical protein